MTLAPWGGPSAPTPPLPLRSPPVDHVSVEERAAALGKRSLKRAGIDARVRAAPHERQLGIAWLPD